MVRQPGTDTQGAFLLRQGCGRSTIGQQIVSSRPVFGRSSNAVSQVHDRCANQLAVQSNAAVDPDHYLCTSEAANSP